MEQLKPPKFPQKEYLVKDGCIDNYIDFRINPEETSSMMCGGGCIPNAIKEVKISGDTTTVLTQKQHKIHKASAFYNVGTIDKIIFIESPSKPFLKVSVNDQPFKNYVNLCRAQTIPVIISSCNSKHSSPIIPLYIESKTLKN